MTEETNPLEERLMTYSELAARLRVSTSTLRRQVKKLRIPYVEMGHQIARFHYPTVLKYLHGLKPKP
jgi:excisionase family DNA binding protein